jgi:methylenetetrahydrofolate dehydrogenase (NADP+)/methenyltetrahydrofolate cyclohydrolase
MIIDGKRISEEVLAHLNALPKPAGFFGAALVGEDPASLNFLRQKERVAQALGIDFRLYQLSAAMTTDDLRGEIARRAAPNACGAFIVQLPLPEGVNRHYVLNAIPKAKDVDCLSEPALGAFYTGRGVIAPPSVAVVEEIISRALPEKDLRGLKAVVLGAGPLIGKPVGLWLQDRVGTLSVFDVTVPDAISRLADADIVVSGTGVPGLFGAPHLKEGALVIDFGFHRDPASGKIMGDFDPADADARHIRFTRTPGGTGPILVAKLFENFYRLAGSR